MSLRKFVAGAAMAGVIVASSAGVTEAAGKDKATSGSVDLTNSEVTPFTTANVGGGTWSYGTDYVFPLSKKVYSNYYHGSKVHSSTSQIGTLVNKSGKIKAGSTSYSDAKGGSGDSTHAYWNTY